MGLEESLPQEQDVAALLRQSGLPERFHLESLAGGANNRVYRVVCPPQRALLKAYHRDAEDPRDRLGAEFAFSCFAWDCGLRCLARPLACDRERSLGLYEFLEGHTLASGEVASRHVEQALDFYRELNRHRSHPLANELPRASEACFSLAEHLACVERRLAPLAELEGSTALEQEAGRFVRCELAPAWHRVRDRIVAAALQWRLGLDAPIAPEEQCISPSDFGFHNAILGADGRLRFFDFEYAGWDDPAKMACDFLCQPAVPVPQACHEGYVSAVVSDLVEPESHRRRISLLLPLYRLKWCCIMLNDFLPVGRRRRRFARTAEDQDQRMRSQLEKARAALQQMNARGMP